jgi:hypothetical protein
LVALSFSDEEADLAGRAIDGLIAFLATQTGFCEAEESAIHAHREGSSKMGDRGRFVVRPFHCASECVGGL